MSNKIELVIVFDGSLSQILSEHLPDIHRLNHVNYSERLIELLYKVMRRFHLSQQSTLDLMIAVFKHNSIKLSLPHQSTFSGRKDEERGKVGKYVVVSDEGVDSFFRLATQNTHRITITGHISKDYVFDVNKHINFTMGDNRYRYPIAASLRVSNMSQAPAKTGKACLVDAWLKENKQQVVRVKEIFNLNNKETFNALIPFIPNPKGRIRHWIKEDYIVDLQKHSKKALAIDNAIRGIAPTENLVSNDSIEAYLLPFQYQIKEHAKVLDMIQLFLIIRCPYSNAVFIRSLPDDLIKSSIVYFKKNTALSPQYSITVKKKNTKEKQGTTSKLHFSLTLDFDGSGEVETQLKFELNINQLDQSNTKNKSIKLGGSQVNRVNVGEKLKVEDEIKIAENINLKPLIIPFSVRDKDYLTDQTVKYYLQEWVTYLNHQFTHFTQQDDQWFNVLNPHEFSSKYIQN
jgi:hypothetical protein